jgi:hypothetical protein
MYDEATHGYLKRRVGTCRKRSCEYQRNLGSAVKLQAIRLAQAQAQLLAVPHSSPSIERSQYISDGLPSTTPSASPSSASSSYPSAPSSAGPSTIPTTSPSAGPKLSSPSSSPNVEPSASPSTSPSGQPSTSPSSAPSFESVSHILCEDFAVHSRTTVTFDGDQTTVYDGDVSVYPGTSITGTFRLEDGQIVTDSEDFAASVLATYAEAMQEPSKPMDIEIGGLSFSL